MIQRQHNDWPPDDIAQLRTLWDEGLSTSAIGLRMGRTKNACIGRAHRLGLPARASPIKRDNGEWHTPSAEDIEQRAARERERQARYRLTLGMKVPGLPPLRSEAPADPVTPLPEATPAAVVIKPVVTMPPVARPAPTPPPAALSTMRYGRVAKCLWPIGEPGTPDYHSCDDLSAPGSSYCPTHHARAYVRVRDRREDYADARLAAHMAK